MDVWLTSMIEAELCRIASQAAPHECCGLLLGRGRRIDRVQPCANVAADPLRHFEIDPAALVAAHRAARGGADAVIGYYHSHPTGDPAPSATDRAGAARDGRVWAIVAGDTVGWWHDGANGFTALSTHVVDG